MARKLEDIAAEALELARESRAALAKRLLDSLDQPSADEVGQGWVTEAERRYQALRSGTARATPSEDVRGTRPIKPLQAMRLTLFQPRRNLHALTSCDWRAARRTGRLSTDTHKSNFVKITPIEQWGIPVL